jgi:hypothetical protein
VYDVVSVEIAFHLHALEVELLVIGGTRQWCEDEEFEQVDGQLALDDADIALDRGGRDNVTVIVAAYRIQDDAAPTMVAEEGAEADTQVGR